MILHNYGPDSWSGSCNVEMNYNMTIQESYEIIHELRQRINEKYKVTLVFGIYPVDNYHKDSKTLRKYVSKFVDF